MSVLRLSAITASIALLTGCSERRPLASDHPADPRWARIDSLANIGQFANAFELTDTVLREAQRTSDWRTEFRAWMYRGRYQQMTGVEQKEILAEIEQRAASSDAPLQQLLRSVLAESWWNYYQGERWQILQRTNTAADVQDPGTWTQRQFMEKIIAEYRASLEPTDTLKKIPVGDLGELLLGDAHARAMRPTLFDLLAHRALAVFSNSETRLTEPSWRFKLDDARVFTLFEDFAYKPFKHRDSTAWEFQAIRLYQELEKLHLGDTRASGLVDVALDRLAYARERSMLQNKDSLYLDALTSLRSRVPDDSCWSEVTLAIASWHVEISGKYERLAGDAWKWEKKTARDLCDSAIARFPGSFGAINAANLKARLEEPSLEIQCEEAVLPDGPFKMALTYANVKQAWARIVKDPQSMELERSWDRDHAHWLAGQKALKEWSVDLPDDGDLNAHLIELPVEGLPYGRYAVLICPAQTFAPGKDLIAYTNVLCTRLALSERRQNNVFDLLVVDRWTGVPAVGVKAALYSDNQRGNGLVKLGETVTTSEGRLEEKLYGANGRYVWSLEAGDDQLISSAGYSWVGDANGQGDSLRTFLFTDRAIYRPGQEVLFKGIVTVKQGTSTETKADHKTTVRLFDVNGERVDSLRVTTDAYGAFQGSFKAPAGTLTGQMRIEEAHGAQWFRLEEYKRPTFEVVFDPIAGQPKLEQQVSATGLAKSYAGVPLDGAEVKWTVKRTPRMPWWCGWGFRGLPWGQETEIASGASACDAEGRFTVTFLAQADRAFPRDADPTFHYVIEASATDINGETQSGSTGLDLGHRSIDIEIGLDDAIDRSTADSIVVRSMNLNGQEVDAPMEVRITRLDAPAKPFRPRLWERPDRFVLSKEEYAMRFPDDPYDNENDPLTWPRAEVALERTEWRAQKSRLVLSGVRDWDVGSYLIEVSARDEGGQEVKVRKHFTVYDTTIENTGFAGEAFHVEPVRTTAEPGEKAVLLLSSAIAQAHILMEVEREGVIAVSRWFKLGNGQQRVELPVLEGDRGGFFIHLLCVERGRAHRETININVPWSNKELKVEWMSFRDKLQPGDEEEWRLRISGPQGEKVAAQLLAAMYDASLDHFVQHDWAMAVWPTSYSTRGWSRVEPFGAANGQLIWRDVAWGNDSLRTYPWLNTYGYTADARYTYYYADGWARNGVQLEAVEIAGRGRNEAKGDVAAATPEFRANGEDKEEKSNAPQVAHPTPPLDKEPQPVRTDFRETAFFFPDLLTDHDGGLVLRFKTPDALTRWKVLGLAHTRDLRLAQFTKETVTQKPLMVFPNLPRFLRAGDQITLTAKINVVEDGRAEGLATLELFDPFTNAAIDRTFGLQAKDQTFIGSKGESAVVSWTITVPEGVDACGVRVTARSKAGPQSTIVAADGEERIVPVLTDKILVTESLPLWASTAGTKTFTLEKLKTSTSTTLRSQSLKLEYTPNPAWYAVQALPYLMEFPHECAEQVFARYYANRLATHIVEQRPAIKQVFEQWQSRGPDAFASALEKNAELKNALLAETPWVVNARSDRERKEHIALLFDLERMSGQEAAALKKLREMQFPGGAWPWWSGMQESRWITQHIVAGLGHLDKLKAADLREDGQVQQMLKNAVRWLDVEMDRDYKRMQREWKKDDLEKYRPGYTEVHYLYARSFFLRWPLDGTTNAAVQFYKDRLAKEWLSYGLQEQAMIALVLHRMDDDATARLIMTSLLQRATKSEELGLYWKGFSTGMDWWSFPTETYALMIEGFNEVMGDHASVNALRTHLLKLKQTTDWRTTKATADACYALLLMGDEWLDGAAVPVITLGGETVKAAKMEAGTGYLEKTWSASEIKPAMGEVTVTTTADKPSWGALHWQYFEQMDKVTPHESPFSIRKQVMLTDRSDNGAQLVALDKSRPLNPGDKLTIRIELRTDRPVDFVHLKDLRAAGLEPTDALSGHKYQGGLGYYQSVRDASMNFFFDHIPAGTFVFEYTLRVTHAGDFSNGITTAQCMYAPEFSSHSEGARLQVAGQ